MRIIDFLFLYGWPFLLACLPYMAGIAVLYIVTATVFLLSAKIEKDSEGFLVLDPESWHFKASYPIVKFSRHETERLSCRINLCGYFLRFFLVLYLTWPVIFVWCLLKTVAYGPFLFLFGFYPVANLESMSGESPFPVEVNRINKLPRIKDYPILPIYIIAPMLYGMSWYFYRKATIYWSFEILFWIAIFVAIIAGIISVGWVEEKVKKKNEADKSSRVGLAAGWADTKKNKICPIMRIKGVSRPEHI